MPARRERPGLTAHATALALSPTRSRAMALLGAAMLPAAAHTQPLEQPRILDGFPPASSGDIPAHRMAERLAGSAYAKQAPRVDNKAGAAGRIARRTECERWGPLIRRIGFTPER